MELTRAERKRLAKEMRELAMECLTNGPEMANVWCGCAIGISMKRAGLWRDAGWRDRNDSETLAEQLDLLMAEDTGLGFLVGIVSGAVRDRIWHENPTAVVFPLLALADEVEQPPAGPPAIAASPTSTDNEGDGNAKG